MSSVKRENNSIVLSSNNILLDIEGTTTSITFVKDVLFPYVRKHLEAYVKENWDAEYFQAIVNALRIQANEDKEKKIDGVIEIPEDGEKDALAKAVIENVLWQMDLDRKTKSLKDLQGLIMEIGYKKGEIKGHVYEDVEPNLKLWTELGKSVYIYSSGSVHAQKLLYGHSEKGDLLTYIKGHFDTTVGNKGDVDSYKKILEEISSSSSETVFFTDIPKEARAAKEAGLLAILMSREGNAPLTDEENTEFQVIKSFSETEFENTSKKRKVCVKNDEKNDNKSIESCEVSLKLPKEPTNSTLTTKPHDTDMEVEESSSEEKVCNMQKSDDKLTNDNLEDKKQNVASENGDIEMETTNDNVEEKKGEQGDKVVESQTEQLSNGDAVPKEIVSDQLKTNEQLDENKKVKPTDPCELEPTTDKKEPVNPGDETILSTNDSHPCEEKTHLEAKQEIKEPSNEKISGNSQVTEQNGDLTHNSSNTTESCKPNIPGTQTKSNPETVMSKSSEKQNNKETVEDKSQPNADNSNGLNSHTNEDTVSDEKKTSESSIVSTNINGSVTSTVTNKPDNMEVDEKQCSEENTNAGDSTVTSSQDDISKDLEADSAKSNEKTPAVLETESVKKSSITSDPVSTMDCNTDVIVKESLSTEDVSKAKATDDGISGNNQPDANKSEETSSAPKKDTEMEMNATQSDVSDIKPCIKTTVDKSSESVGKSQIVDESSSNQVQPKEVATDDINIQRGKESGEIGCKNKPVDESCTNSEKEPKLADTVPAVDTEKDLEMKSVSKISAETQNQSDSVEKSDERNDCEKAEIPKLPQDCEKAEIPKLPQNSNEGAAKESSCDNTKEETDKKNDVKEESSDHLNEKEKSKMSVNGKVDDDEKSLKCSDANGLKNEINGTALCEVKKCEVPENATVAAVVEA